MKVNFRNAQISLVVTFLIFVAVQLGCIVASYLIGKIYAEDLVDLLVRVLAIYSVPLATIIGGTFGRGDNQDVDVPRTVFGTAFVLAFLWNCLLVWRSIAFVLGEGDFVGDFSSYLTKVSSASSFLVAGALAYFFSRRD